MLPLSLFQVQLYFYIQKFIMMNDSNSTKSLETNITNFEDNSYFSSQIKRSILFVQIIFILFGFVGRAMMINFILRFAPSRPINIMILKDQVSSFMNHCFWTVLFKYNYENLQNLFFLKTLLIRISQQVYKKYHAQKKS